MLPTWPWPSFAPLDGALITASVRTAKARPPLRFEVPRSPVSTRPATGRLTEDVVSPRRVLGGSGETRARARQEPDHLFLLLPGQGRPGNRAMRKTGSLGPPALKGRPDQLDTPGRPARPARPASATRPSAPTSPASLPARGT